MRAATILCALALLAACSREEEPVANRYARTKAEMESKARAYEAQADNEVSAAEARLDNETAAFLERQQANAEAASNMVNAAAE
ncbi:MAG TPA: hypothetical protein VGX37_12965 [Allosphingosinicella sp.]|jgi:hypothetical protein|nr:hypothetical protein [Allosphingosinicella sp.]